MSETVTPPVEESVYPPLSEATDNDVREAPQETPPATPSEEPPKDPTPPEAPPEEPTEEVDAAAEEQARTARLARELREQKRRARQFELEAQALRGQRQEQPNEAMEREIAQRAAAMAQQQQINQKANNIYAEGCREYGRTEFDDSVKHMNETFGQLTPIVIDTLTDIENAPKLIQHLADNPDIADTLAGLPPHKLGAALAREASKLARPKPPSKAPPPIRPISTTSTAEVETDLEKMSMEDLAKLWDKRDFQKRMGF